MYSNFPQNYEFASQNDLAEIKIKRRFLDKIDHKQKCEQIRNIMKQPKHKRVKSTQINQHVLLRDRSDDKYTKKSPQISRKPEIESLCFRNHNIDSITSKRSLGGGFQIRAETDTKETEDIRTILLKQRKLKEIKVLHSKVMQLENFDLGISSSETSRYEKVTFK